MIFWSFDVFVKIRHKWNRFLEIYIYMQFTPRNAEYPLQGTESEEKEEKYENI